MENDQEVYYNISEESKNNSQIYKNLKNSKNDAPLMDAFINSYGYSLNHYKTILFTCLILFLDGIHMTLLNSTFIPFREYYELTDTQVSLISSTMFIAVGCGSLLTVFPNLVGKRVDAIIRYTFIMFLSNLLLGLIPLLVMFIFFRFLIGVCIGVILPLIINLLCESLPLKNRSLTMIFCGVFFGLGATFVNILMLIFTPNLEKEGIYSVYLYTSIAPLLSAIIFYFNLEDSPRSLILDECEEEAMTILEKMINKKLSQIEKETIINQTRSRANKISDEKLSYLFEGEFKKITIILIIIWMVNSYLAYGGTITFGLVIDYMQKMKNANNPSQIVEKDNHSIIIEQMLVYLVSSPGSFLAGFMTEIEFFGRKITTLIGFLFVAIFATLGLFDLDNFAIYFSIAGFFINFSFNASGSYSSEVYPTKLRNMGVGFLNFCNRVSGFLSQFIAVQLFKINYLLQIYFSIIICLIACFITYSLPYDTHGKLLDSHEFANDNNDNNHNKSQKEKDKNVDVETGVEIELTNKNSIR
jgi:MFS family permease